MLKKQCIVCSSTAGKRVCKINDNELICPVCCAKSRNPECEGCEYYIQAEKYSKESKPASISAKKKPDTFVMRIDPEINEKVDYALSLAENGKVEAAEKIIGRLLNSDPNLDIVHYGMGVICLLKDENDKALRYFNKAVEINPYFAEAWYNKAAAHHSRLEIEEMIRAYRQVIEYGDEKENYVNRAKKVIRDFEKQVRELNNLSLDGYMENAAVFKSAFLAMEKREFDKAIKGFQEVISNDPQHVQAYGNLGVCYGHIGEKQKALDVLDKALELDPTYEPAIINKHTISLLGDKEKLSEENYGGPVEYYKDYASKKKSLIKKILG